MKQYRIFLILGEAATSHVPGSTIWVRNIYNTLIELGHDVFHFNIDSFGRENNVTDRKRRKILLSEKLENLFLKEYKVKQFDLIFSYLWDSMLDSSVVNSLKRYVPFVNFTTNYHQFELYKNISKEASLSIYISKVAKEGFDSLNCKSYWMPLAANEGFYNNTVSSESEMDVSFVGTPYGNRPYYLWRVLQHNININIFGGKWILENNLKNKIKYMLSISKCINLNYETRLNRINELERLEIVKLLNKKYRENLNYPPNDEAYVKILKSSKININTSESRFGHSFANKNVLIGANLRDFEVTVSGGFLLTYYSKEIENFFKLGVEIETWSNEVELVDKLTFYLKNEKARKDIAFAGQKKALSEHTWKKRFIDFFEFYALEF